MTGSRSRQTYRKQEEPPLELQIYLQGIFFNQNKMG